MSDGGKLVVGFLLVVIVLWILGQIFTATIGYLLLALIFGVIVALVVALVRVSMGKHASSKIPLNGNADKIAEKKLKQVERKMEAERIKH